MNPFEYFGFNRKLLQSCKFWKDSGYLDVWCSYIPYSVFVLKLSFPFVVMHITIGLLISVEMK